ncbi:hypothetical protein HPG69_010612 [Diceros bicornis minor]|uniref:Large ribosomal subunit protein uL11 N-terminal domain-containing protein n=1 Tax=Diceros bicornis minor TaxID=77932 RepID=A0A7J7FGF5_DICBM|nr:hypothetical protein HPG69_010612 [Diceros bicornis minor]
MAQPPVPTRRQNAASWDQSLTQRLWVLSAESCGQSIGHLRCMGGEVGASSALAPKISPLGLSPKKFGDTIAKAVSDRV